MVLVIITMLVIIVSDRKKFRRKMSELRKAESFLFGKNRKEKKREEKSTQFPQFHSDLDPLKSAPLKEVVFLQFLCPVVPSYRWRKCFVIRVEDLVGMAASLLFKSPAGAIPICGNGHSGIARHSRIPAPSGFVRWCLWAESQWCQCWQLGLPGASLVVI